MATFHLLQITDTHLTPDDNLAPGVHPRENLIRGLRMLDDTRVRPDVVLLTGDLADAGDAACYSDLKQILTDSRALEDALVIFVPGNHDDRDGFSRILLGAPGGTAPIDRTYWHRELRIVTLDSAVPGEDGGFLGEASLDHLRAEIATRAPEGTVVVVHHPPIPSPIEPMAAMNLRNAESLRTVVEGSDVRLILCGHNHHGAAGSLGGVPVWVSPACAYRADVTSRERFVKLRASAFSQIDLTETGHVATEIPFD